MEEGGYHLSIKTKPREIQPVWQGKGDTAPVLSSENYGKLEVAEVRRTS